MEYYYSAGKAISGLEYRTQQHVTQKADDTIDERSPQQLSLHSYHPIPHQATDCSIASHISQASTWYAHVCEAHTPIGDAYTSIQLTNTACSHSSIPTFHLCLSLCASQRYKIHPLQSYSLQLKRTRGELAWRSSPLQPIDPMHSNPPKLLMLPVV